ncbi:hypothetical protein BGX23_007449 [Mortierella sp. AD031]|nr:hypothetical protein BGX23_007449 [Mortierella sp. AD031]
MVQNQGSTGSQDDNNPVVTIPGFGTVKGILDPSHKVAKFLNVPFGTIEERWRPAVKAKQWQGIRDGTKNGPMTPQQTESHPFVTMLLGDPETASFDDTMDERDCLHCNIFMPASALTSSSNQEEQRLPVMVYLYGGGFRAGNNASPIYDCTDLLLTSLELNKPFIAVVINYRVNFLGFITSKELLLDAQEHARRSTIPESERRWYDASVGNWGLLDQILGLEWVQDHIKAFSGDRRRVTVMGESAGAMSISLLQFIPQAHGLFRRAIMQSGGGTTFPLDRVEKGQAIFDHLCFRFGVEADLPPLEKVARLRAVPAKSLAEELNKIPLLFFRPALDGVVFKKDSRLLVSDPSVYDPNLEWVVAGGCKDEGSVFATMFGASSVAAFGPLKARICAPADYDLFDKIFGVPQTDMEAIIISARLTGDGIFKYPSLQVSQAIMAHPTCQLSRFHFDTQLQGEEAIMPNLGAHHGIGVFFTFGGKVASDLGLTEKEKAMIKKIQATWIEVITAESPESSSLPKVSNSVLPSRESNYLEVDPKEAIVFGSDMAVHECVVERMPAEEVEFWKRSSAYALEQTELGRSAHVFFDFSQGLFTTAP